MHYGVVALQKRWDWLKWGYRGVPNNWHGCGMGVAKRGHYGVKSFVTRVRAKPRKMPGCGQNGEALYGDKSFSGERDKLII